MTITYDETAITFIASNSWEVASISYLQPYRFGATGYKFKVPATLTTLDEIANKFGVPSNETNTKPKNIKKDKRDSIIHRLDNSLLTTLD